MPAFLSLLPSGFAEAIVPKAGKIIECTIIERTDKFIKVNINGIPITCYIKEIERIDGKRIGESSRPSHSFVANIIKKSPSQILNDVSPAGVVILTPTADNHGIANNNGSGFIVDGNGIVFTCLHV